MSLAVAMERVNGSLLMLKQAWKQICLVVVAEDLPKTLAFKFDVSQNEEHVSLQVDVDGKVNHLGERNHHYLILMLARQYIQDVGLELLPSECGWIDKNVLCRMLGQNESHLNIQVFRFRKQIMGLCGKIRQFASSY